MKKFKKYIKEEYVSQQVQNSLYEHFNEEYSSADDMTLGDRLDLLNDEIEALEDKIIQSDELDEKIEAVASMVNKARFYAAFTVIGSTK